MDMEQQAPGAATEAGQDAAQAEQQPAEQEKAPRRTARRRSASSPAGAPVANTGAAASGGAGASGVTDGAAGADAAASDGEMAPAAPKKATRSRRKTTTAKDAAAHADVAESNSAGEAPAESPSDAAPETVPDTADKPAAGRSRRRTSARAAAVKADTRLPEPQEPVEASAPEEPLEVQPAASRAKSSVRARRRASGKTETAEAPAKVAPAAAPTEPVARPEAAESPAEAPAEPRGVVREAALEQPAAEKAPRRRSPREESAPAAVEGPRAPAQEEAASTAEDADQPQSGFTALFSEAISPTSMIFQAPDLSAIVRPAPAAEPVDEEEQEEDEDTELTGRRRRRGRGRRSRPARGAESGEDHAGEEGEDSEPAEDSELGEAEGVTSRRRRRRRRGEVDLELEGGLDNDPPGTVTRVRAPRTPSESTSTRVQSLKGSTRLEAKKQRRRESRESGRRRHVITEAEFLARRESVDRQMVVRQKEDRIQIAVLEDGVLAEHFVSKTQQDSLIGNVYLGRVQNVLPSMEAAFVDIGRGRNAVLYAGEVNWDAAGLDGAPRRIENALKSGDSVLVQVTKDPVGHKGARLTSQISLPGRYLVYVPGGSMTGISRKLPDVERARLKKILKDHLPEDAGVIVRTAAEGASEEELTHDINRLRAQWESIQSQASSTKVLAPELLYGEPDLTIKVVRDVFNEDFSKLIISGDEAWDTIEAYVTYVAPDLLGRLEKYQGDDDIFAQWRVDEQIHKALDRKVFLPSGGSLVIDRTEAMTVVDVNTGKFTGSGGNLEETVTKNNLEAAEEIVRQLRLRDIGGIIVIDFIDMVLESNRDLVLRRLVECLGRDPHQAPGGRGHLARSRADDPQAHGHGPPRGLQRDVRGLCRPRRHHPR
nr:Rne/Rng family ribonuclease [Corynebacterium cyclohexanicum]